MQVELTRISEKGQVVIPSSLRNGMGKKKSDQFMVFGEGGTVILKKIETPAIKMSVFHQCNTGGKLNTKNHQSVST